MTSIILVGFMGCGKSTVGRLLAEKTDRQFTDMDTYIEEQAGCTVSEIFATEGEAAFRAKEHDACVTLGSAQDLVVATGGGAVLRADNIAALKKNGVIVWLQVSADTVLARLAQDTTRPLLQRADKEAAVHALLAERTLLYAQAADITVNADGDAQTVAAAIVAALAAR